MPQFHSCAPALALVVVCQAATAADAPPTEPAAPEQSVVISAQKLPVETLVDRKVYNITSDVQASFGAVSDVLSAIPSVDVDPDGNVSLRGDSHVLILIDGKPSTLFSGAQSGENLQAIPAKDIERIEVLPTPPPEFKADGTGGVINIITRKKRQEGIAGSLQGGLGNSGRTLLGGDSSYRSGPLSAALSASFRNDVRDRTRASEVLAPGAVVENSMLRERQRRQIPTVTAKAEYALDDQQSLSGSFSWLERGGLRTYTQLNDSSTPAGTLSSSRRISAGRDPHTQYDERLSYTRQLARPHEEIEVSVHRSTSSQREHYDYINDSFIPAAETFYNNLDRVEDYDTTDVGVDYALPFSKQQSLKLGYAFEQEDFRFGNRGADVDPLTGVETLDPNVTHRFQFRQQINAGYASYQANTENWSVLAGLRAELTRTNARLLTTDAATRGSYFEIYPSLHVNHALSDASTLSFGASRRVRRPEPDDLDPYMDYEYTPNLIAGNAHLQPQYTQSYEIGYGFEGPRIAYQATAYYRRNRNTTTDVTEYLGDGISLTTKTNLPRNDAAGLELTSSGRILSKLNYSVSANPFYSEIDASALGLPGLQSTTGINAKLKLDYRPSAFDTVQLTLTRTDERLTPQGYVSARNIVNVGYKHQARPDLSAIVTFSDVFNGQRTERFERTPTFEGNYLRTVEGRVLYMGVIYSFGSASSDKQFEYEQ